MFKIWPKRAFLNFPKKCENVIFFRLQRLGLVQKLANSNEWIAKKCENLHFWQFGPKWPILDSFWPKWAKREFFSKKRLVHFSRAYKPCKVSEKSNERFSSNRVTDGRTYGRTHEWTRILRSPTNSSRDQKMVKILI